MSLSRIRIRMTPSAPVQVFKDDAEHYPVSTRSKRKPTSRSKGRKPRRRK
jgi:hypothetical protein